MAYKKFLDAKEKRTNVSKQAFAVVLGQCSPSVVDCLKASDSYAKNLRTRNLINLLRLIQTLMYSGAMSKNPMHSLVKAR